MAADFASALRLVDSELSEQADQVWVIGGSSIYKVRSVLVRCLQMEASCLAHSVRVLWDAQEMMESPAPRRLIVTRIQKQFECDTFFPEIRPEQFRLLPE